MTRDQLVARLRVVEGYLSAARELSLLTPEHAGTSPVEQDFVTHDALRMLDRSGTPAFIYELEGGLRVLDANYAFAAMSGFLGNDLWTLCLTDLLGTEVRPKLFRALSKPQPRGFVETRIWHGRTKAGESKQVVASGHDLIFQGRPARFVVLHPAPVRQDPRTLLTQLLAVIPTAVYLRSPDGVIESWNASAEKLLGFAPNEVIGENEATLFPSEVLSALRELAAVKLSDDEVLEQEISMRRKDGTLIPVQLTAAAVPDEARAGGSSIWVLRAGAATPASTIADRPASESTTVAPQEWRWEQDDQLCFIHHSEEAERGPDPYLGSVLGKSLLELPVRWLAVEDKRRYEHAVSARRAFQDIELRIPEQAGKERSVLISGGPLFDERGNFLGYRGVGGDLTQRRRNAAQLQLLATLLNVTEDAIFTLSVDLSIMTWNAGAEQLLGYSRAEVAGKRVAVLIAMNDGKLLDEITARARGAHDLVQRESILRHKNGSDVALAASCSAVRNTRGTVLGLALILRDIQHTKVLQNSLAARNQVLQRALDSVPLHLWTLDMESGRMHYDESFGRLLGYASDELPVGVGAFAGLVESDDAPQVLRALRALQHNEKAEFDATFRVCKQNGELLWVQARGWAPPSAEGETPALIQGTCTDITAAKYREQSRKLLATLAEANDAVVLSHAVDGLVLSWSAGAEHVLGYRAAEIIGAGHDQLLPESVRGEYAQAVQQLIGGVPMVKVTSPCRRRDGTVVEVEWVLAPVRDSAGHVQEIAAMGQLPSPIAPLMERALKLSEARLHSLMEATHQVVWITNAQGEMHVENLSWQNYTGLTFEESHGSGWISAVHSDDREHAMLRWSSALAGGSVYECPQRVLRADGQWRQMIARAVPVRGEDGGVREWIGIHTDVTEQRNVEDALRESEGRLQSILNSAAEGIVVIDSSGSIERLNLAAQRMFGYTPEDYWSLDLKHLIIELDREFEGESSEERYAAWLRRMIGSQRDLTGRRKDGRLFPLELSVNEVSEGGHQTRFVGIVRDVTERKSWEARIFQLAYSDSLTGLPNRLLLVDRLEQAVAAAQRNKSLVGVLFFDFDGFKQVNDRYGHHSGDLLLKGMSDRIRNCVREIDTVSRLGGDEFVVVLPELKDGGDAGAVARKITAALSQPYSIEHHEISITLTAGISIYPNDGESAEILIRNADTAMYFAKESGKNRYRFFNTDLQALH